MKQLFALKNTLVIFSRNTPQITYDIEIPLITCSESHIMQLLQNLIMNAIKYCDKSIPIIHLKMDDKGDHWLFTIKDNGIGISKKEKQNIFEMFGRGHNQHKEIEGSGIGLATCKKIIQRHHGDIWYESMEGQGTSFFFTIPKQLFPAIMSTKIAG